ncbi:hypothetical protein LTS08_003949 [Lithohypha guttulata]|nr:hypothetical protein LTS08_003949 [Lithohypha guttulata]
MLHAAPVLELKLDKLHEIDPRNVENLFGMWTVFSRCASTIPDGKRLENMSWRVWARETLCCPPQPEKTIVPAIDIPLPPKEDVPSLSNSLASVSSDGDSIRTLEHSALSKSRGVEQHLTPTGLEKIITKIHETEHLVPLDPEIRACVAEMSPPKQISKDSPVSENSDQKSINSNIESSCISTATNTTNDTTGTERDTQHRGSDTSVSSSGLIRSGSVVHGFSPVPSIRTRGSSSISKAMPVLSRGTPKNATSKKTAMFTMGGSSEDDESSFEQNMSYRRQILEPRKSSLSKSMSHDDRPRQQKKTTSFREVVEQHNIQTGGSPADDNAIASDDEDDDSAIDDSAIEEDDEDGWEDEQPEEEKSTVESVFKRVDSTAHLPSRRSILTAGLTEGDRAKGLLSAASKSSPAIRRMDRTSSHNGLSIATSSDGNDEEGPMMMRPSSNSRAIPISPPNHQAAYAMAHSPRTTRRNMLSTELTESLRKNLLWERQQKNTTINAFLKREAKSMANLHRAGQTARTQGGPTRNLPSREPIRNNNSFDDCFNVANEYHTKGW